MSQPEISPLARRLAEENNVDWRDLHGSGAGGKVVERDVLEYLARVMAGEEDLDPTPEPVPDGMEAWPEEDVHAFQAEIRASSKNVGLHEIQQELSASDRLADGPSAADLPPEHVDAPSTDGGAAAQGDDISEDIFLFDDEDEATPSGAEPGRTDDLGWPAEPRAKQSDGDDDLLVAGEDGPGWAGDLEDTGVEAAEEEALWTEPAPQEAPERLPDVFAGTEETPRAAHDLGDDALFDDGEARATEDTGPEELAVPSLGDLDLEGEERAGERYGELYGGAAEEDRFYSDAEAEFGPGFDAPGFDAPGDEEAHVDLGAGMRARPEGGPVYEAPIDEAPADEAPADEVPADEVPAGQAPTDEVAAADAPAVPPSGASAWSSEPDADHVDASPAEVPATADVPPPAMEERMGAGAVTAAGRVPSELPLVSYGTLLRRHLDVTALASAQLAVGLELGGSEPLPPGPFLLRAAAKAIANGGWGDGPVAVIGWDERGELRVGRVADAERCPFVDLAREVSEAIDAGSADANGVSLAVADMSALEVDEAVLNVDAPLITLGRILYDNQRGSYRSTLSLAGDVAPERGARLLARVAELLDAPVRLLL